MIRERFCSNKNKISKTFSFDEFLKIWCEQFINAAVNENNLLRVNVTGIFAIDTTAS